jgi:hypothetical protein
MRKVQFIAVFWTLFLAVPFTVLAISGLRSDRQLTGISTVIANFNQSVCRSRGILVEFSGRWPEGRDDHWSVIDHDDLCSQ